MPDKPPAGGQVPTGGAGNDPPDYSSAGNSYPSARRSYSPAGQSYPPPGQSYPPPGQSYPPPGQTYPPPGQSYPPRSDYGSSYPPSDYWSPRAPERNITYAGWWRRAAGYVIDLVVLLLAGIALLAAFRNERLAAGISAEVVQLAYLSLMVGSRGQTLGMMAVGIRLLDAKTGSPQIGYPRALLRAVAAAVISAPSVFVNFGLIFPLLNYLWPVWDNRNQTWHDKIAGTVAVKV